VLEHYAQAQAVYLFGTFGTVYERPESDADVAVLLPPCSVSRYSELMLSDCRFSLEDALGCEVDLLSLRDLSTVLQNEIVASGRRLGCFDEGATAQFEYLSLSLYQKLNWERAEIVLEFEKRGRLHHV